MIAKRIRTVHRPAREPVIHTLADLGVALEDDMFDARTHLPEFIAGLLAYRAKVVEELQGVYVGDDPVPAVNFELDEIDYQLFVSRKTLQRILEPT